MDKCREAFENSLGHTDGFHDGYVTYNPITGMYESNDDDYECVADWLNGALSVWQSRQAEVDQLQSQINEMAEVGLSQESAIREKDKRIERATAKWISIVTILTTTDTGVPDAIFKQLDQLHDALCGMNEIGDNNANY
ncbi:hypothetical protein ACG9X2_10575 [Acinetobacter bereziniae]|uniref:hypothetical protein n=1 Tax=Acinetobacter bereziniae TaxID=106648 RepID=UPI003AF9646D